MSEERPAQNLQEDYARYRVFDEHYEEIGKVDDLFVDENDQPEYLGVKMGFLGMKSTLIPMDIVRANDRRELLEVAASKEDIKNAPSFDDDETVSPEHEAEIRRYYGLPLNAGGSPRGDYSSDRGTERQSDVDLEYGERGQTEEPREATRPSEEGSRPPQANLGEPAARESTDEDELRVQRTEEELRAGTREREAGAVNVRRRVRTDREQVRVPKKREEVTVERVPAGDEPASERSERGSPAVESDEEEIRIPVVEEEVVVEKRPVVKEELRIKKKVVEEEEIVEEDVRKEEIEVEGEANYRDR